MTEVKWNEIKRLTLEMDEQELTVTALRNEDIAYVFCSDNVMLTKLKAAMKENPEEYKCFIKYVYPDGSIGGYEFQFPKKYLKFLSKERAYNMTPEKRLEAQERMKRAREAKK